jgi:hypothetical protein
MKDCFHEIVYCDSNGKSCRLCGTALEGYGVAVSFPGKQKASDRCMHGPSAWRIINESEEQCVYCLHIYKINTLSCEESGRCNIRLPFSKLVFFHEF